LHVQDTKMNTKLTLKLDKTVIEKAKEYAASHNGSLSKLIESYLKSLVNQQDNSDNDEIKISAFVSSMRTGKKIPAGLNHKKEYVKHLADKYK